MKIVAYDIETLPNLSIHWKCWNENIPHKNIIESQTIVSISWSIVGQNKVYSTSIADDEQRFKANIYDDYHPVKTFHQYLKDAGSFAYLYHNGDKFDQRKFQTACIKHGLDPLGKRQSIDTLKVAKKHFKFDSNRLDYLGRYLEVGEKLETGGMQLWNEIVQAKYPEVGKEPDLQIAQSAIKKMVAYNKQDVRLLIAVYEKLKPWIDNHPNATLYENNQIGCTTCGGKDYKFLQWRFTTTRKYKRYWCNSCKKPFDPPPYLKEYYDYQDNPVSNPHENRQA